MPRLALGVTFGEKGNPSGQERMLAELKQSFRDARTGQDGYIHLLTDERFGAVLRPEPGD
jgi:hypothetical protein